ncbi:asparaginase [Arthrobacter sp. CAN_C5]|uniref:asparaginase n=1 Tax=Arthrobacter sp. CAN_C5 TaxID=2760706 RepID=UPI001AE55E89|nr:asparaginase [Arthrobacter sp. CAN_C5]MBP2218077.1 L-asparaginase [Arthrobacter sp. CAN_C5]
MNAGEDQYVVLLATGGTIASRNSAAAGGATVAEDSGEVLLQSTGYGSIPVKVVDVMRKGSYRLTFPDMLDICSEVKAALSDPLVVGVVVTHGTDTTEETSYLADLLHDDWRPVVFTGAQFAADHPTPDGPDNLRRAIAVATSRDAGGRGALVSFAGQIFHSAGVRKVHTTAHAAFDSPDSIPAGSVTGTGVVSMDSRPARFEPLPAPQTGDGVGFPRTDVVASYPGADAVMIEAALAAGAAGIVLEATGIGNANPVMCTAVAEATAGGAVVVTSTRVHAGPVVPVYGTGGGKDLLAAGAIPSGLLRPGQARILLQLLLALGMTRPLIEQHFHRRGLLVPQDSDALTALTPSKG